MNRLSDLVYPATVRAQQPVESKRAFFQIAGQLAASALGLDAIAFEGSDSLDNPGAVFQ